MKIVNRLLLKLNRQLLNHFQPCENDNASFIDKLLMSKKLKFIDKPLLKYAQHCEKKKIAKEEKWKKHCLDNYGAYHNADELTHEEMLEVFWKVLKNSNSCYDTSKFDSNTDISEPLNQSWEWGDLGSMEFFIELERVFGFSYRYITDNEYEQIKTFGELADLMIKKAKEKT
jgi:hypothetical protein